MLSWLAAGQRLDDVFRAVQEAELSIRGQPTQLTYDGELTFSLACRLRLKEWNTLGITIECSKTGLHVVSETMMTPPKNVPLYEATPRANSSTGNVSVAYNSFSKPGKKPRLTCNDQQAVFTQLLTPARFSATHKKSQATIPRACENFIESLRNILFLDPLPQRMRNTSFADDRKLRGDGRNLSSVLYALAQDSNTKATILAFIKDLPEQHITDIQFLVGARNDVLVQLEETFGSQKRLRDATLLSDGTLRVLAVAAALLSAPEFSTVVMEEIDNGIHPSRARDLLASVQRIATERNLSVLITSHNPALLDALPESAIPDVVFCYRDPKEGDSRLVRLEDLPNYAELVARGPLGRLVTQGILDRMVKQGQSQEERTKAGLRYVEELKTVPA